VKLSSLLLIFWSLTTIISIPTEAATRARSCQRVLTVKPVGYKPEKLFEQALAENPNDFSVPFPYDVLVHRPTGVRIAYQNGYYEISLGTQRLSEVAVRSLTDYPTEDFGEEYVGQSTYTILEEQFAEYGLGITSNRRKGGTITLHSPWLSLTLSSDALLLNSQDPLAKAIQFKTDLAKVPDYVLGVLWPEDSKPNAAGFRIGQKNSNTSIRRMAEGNYRLNGIKFKETYMRPGEAVPKDADDLKAVARGEGVYRDRSDNGFISENEKLADVLIEQNDLVLKEMGTTHQKLMGPIYRIISAFRNGFISSNQIKSSRMAESSTNFQLEGLGWAMCTLHLVIALAQELCLQLLA